jgi:hypothetical protein
LPAPPAQRAFQNAEPARTALKPVQRALDWLGHSTHTGAMRQVAMSAIRVTYSTPRPVLPHRLDLPLLLNRRGLVGCGAEVGVKRGEYSEVLLEGWSGRHLISIDPWLSAPETDYVDVANVAQETHDRYYEETVDRLARFGERSTVWRMTGSEAADRIPAHCLDFVYLDARHDYVSVKQDLDTWMEKLRPGGILAGHDYLDGTFAEGHFGVKSAVDELGAAHGLSVRATFADPPWRSWHVVIP